MTTPTGDDSLPELETIIRTELTRAEASQPDEDALAAPIDERLFDPTDAQLYEVGLRDILGAVETMEGESRPGGETSPPAGASG
jgi:hypothetical protein